MSLSIYLSMSMNAARYEAKELELWVEPTPEEMDEMEAELMKEAEEDLVGEFLKRELECGGDFDEVDSEEEEEEEEVAVPIVVKKRRKKKPAPAPVKELAAGGKKTDKSKPVAKQNGSALKKGKKKQGNGTIAAAEDKKRPVKKPRE
jgi:hypothetical protein